MKKTKVAKELRRLRNQLIFTAVVALLSIITTYIITTVNSKKLKSFCDSFLENDYFKRIWRN